MHQTLNRMREKRGNNDNGFTLIELLVVVVIIGVLVAIAVPVYLNYRQGAADKSAQSDVRGAISAIEQYYTDNGNTYPASIPTTSTSPITIGTTQKITLSDKTSLTYLLASTGTSYLICGTNAGGSTTTGTLTKVYLYDSAAGGSVKAPTPAVKIATCAV